MYGRWSLPRARSESYTQAMHVRCIDRTHRKTQTPSCLHGTILDNYEQECFPRGVRLLGAWDFSEQIGSKIAFQLERP
jgi:hypothetical protein